MNMKHWDAMKRPPVTALKTIKAGRLSGMSDINPQWRLQVMTEQYGECGVGWYYTVERFWTEQGAQGEVMCFVHVHLHTRNGSEWSAPITGIGGSALVAKESAGLRANDEGYKMATTDALSVAMKQLGVAADIYMGLWDGSKYKEPAPATKPPVKAALEGVQIDTDTKDKIKELAADLVHYVEGCDDPVTATNLMLEAELDSDCKLFLWDVLQPNSRTRSALKKELESRKGK